VQPGFRAAGVFAFEIGLPAKEYDPAARARTWQDLTDAVRQIDVVQAVGAAEFLPLSTDFRKGPLLVEGSEPPEGQSGPMVDLDRVTPGIFAALGVPLLQGRMFARDDSQVVVVNQALVDQDLGGGPALGRRIRITNRSEYAEIIGVVGNMRSKSFRDEPLPYVYMPPRATTPSSPEVPQAMSFAVRSDAPPARLLPLLDHAVARIDPKLPLGSPRAFTADVREHLARQDLVTWVVLGMAALGLLLAAVGVYGVVAYVVAQRRKDLGVRIALGADTTRVLAHAVVPGLTSVAVGAVVGLVVSVLARRLVAGLIYGVTAGDPLTYGLATLLVLATAAAASLPPAWRASRMDASAVLREE
jgi:predicted permease